MDNCILRIGYLSSKLKLKALVLFIIVFAASLTAPFKLVYAVPYGDGNYGANLYGEDFPASSPASAQTCSDSVPKSAPAITLVSGKSSTEIKLTFTHATDPVTYYALEYGPESQKYIYSAANIGNHDATTYTVQKLSPNSTYYFRLRAGNGCMPGEWSAEVSGKTLGRFSTKTLDLTNTTITPVETATSSGKPAPVATPVSPGYDVDVTVVNTKNEPVLGAKVTIHSDPQEATTNQDGVVHFKGVAEGSHTLLIAYGDYSGEESIFLNGQVKIFKITVTVEEKNVVFSKPALSVIAVLMGAVILLTAIIFIRRKRA